MRKTVVINAVGLTSALLGEDTPHLTRFAGRGRVASIGHVSPAVTCSVQSTYLTGRWPDVHGIVGNGWYFHDECEIKFWRQSDRLVQSPRIWDIARQRNRAFTCANICWWHAMYSSADVTVTPRPMYPADGRKLPDIWTNPPALREQLQDELGQFPLFKFWGPAAGIESSAWIAQAAMRVEQVSSPTLSLIYLPHLDYILQKRGPGHPEVAAELRTLDRVAGELIDFFEAQGAAVIVLCEYGIAPVTQPVHVNRVLRQAGHLAVRSEMGREVLDAGASDAFAVADHQVAHIYVNDMSKIQQIRHLLAHTPGVSDILDEAGKAAHHLNHPRAGDLVAVADAGSWFTYYYWLDEAKRPDFATTVDIHRKPGYDPAELFLDPYLKFPRAQIAAKLMKRKLGFRSLLDVIPTDATLVRGSHGRLPTSIDESPLLISNCPDAIPADALIAVDVMETILRHAQLSP